MEVFVLGRAVQGLGSGMQIVSLYVVVARVFPEELHGRAFAAMSAAWVLPAIVGPGLAGLVAEHLDWRWVFLGLVPVVVVGAVLVLSVTRTPPREQGAALAAPRATLGAAAVVAGSLAVLQLAGNEARWWSLPVAAVAVAVAVRPFTSLLPPGSLRLAPGVPSLVILRGLLCAAFFGAEAFIPLTLTRLHGMSPSEVGLPLTLGALGWGAGSWYQGRSPESRRLAMLRAGLVLVSAGILPLALLASTTAPTGVAVASWAVAGLGMGLAMPSISVVTLAASEPGMHGANSASLQICDITASVVAIGAAGSVLTGVAPHHAGEAVVGVYVALAGVAALGVIVTRRVLVSSRG
jgi:predicted MFS family arabinose efflux permease